MAISCEAPSLPKLRGTTGRHHTAGSTRSVWGLLAHDLQQHGSRPGWFQLSEHRPPKLLCFQGAAARKLWQREWVRDIMAHNRANTGLGCCILVRKSLETLFRIEGFSLWRPSEAGTARSLGTEVAVHCLCKGQQRRDRCLSRTDECYFAKNREDLLSILQDLNQPALPSSPLKLSPLRDMEAGLTLPLFPLSVLPPLSFLRKAG